MGIVIRDALAAVPGPDGIEISRHTIYVAGDLIAGFTTFYNDSYGAPLARERRENIELGCKIKNIPLDSRRKTEEILVNELGLQDKLERYPIQLSGGEQQRVGLARVFLLRPDVLLMDEPFSALDVITRESIQKVFFSLWKDVSVTTVFVTHFIEEAVFLGQQIIVFSKHPGKILSTIQNPFFGRKDKVQSEEYLKFVYNLRLLLEKELNE